MKFLVLTQLLGSASLLSAYPYVHRTHWDTSFKGKGVNPYSPDYYSGFCSQENPSEVQSNFWEHIYPNFCDQFYSRKKNYFFEKSFTSADYIQVFQGDANSVLTPPPNGGMYQPRGGNPFRFDFRFDPLWGNGTSAANSSCHTSCSSAFYKLADGSCGRTGGQSNHIAANGHFDAGCGTFSYFIASPDGDETRCPVGHWMTGPHDQHPSRRWRTEDAADAIEKYCSGNDTASMIVKNSIEDYGDLSSPELPVRRYKYDNHTVIQISAAFAVPPGLDGKNCNSHANQEFKIIGYGDQCKSILHKTISRCNDGNTLDTGGVTVEHDADHGCAAWEIFAYETFKT